MELHGEIQKRLTRAIQEAIKPPVLIGAKWFRPCPGAPAGLQFLGLPKIVKATGRPAPGILKELIRRANLAELGLRAEMCEDGTVNIAPAKPAEAPSAMKGSPPRCIAAGSPRAWRPPRGGPAAPPAGPLQ